MNGGTLQNQEEDVVSTLTISWYSKNGEERKFLCVDYITVYKKTFLKFTD